MKHIILVFGTTDSTQTALKCLHKIVESPNSTTSGHHPNGSTWVKVVHVEPDIQQIVDGAAGQPHNSWLSLEDAVSSLTKSPCLDSHKKQYQSSVSKEMQDLARILHDTADSLPYLGSTVDIIMCMNYQKGTAQHYHSYLPVTGSIRRLVEWHNARPLIVKQGAELSALELQLVEFGHCQVVDCLEELTFDWPRWRGKVAVMDRIENQGHIFTDFWLECADWKVLLEQKLPPPPLPPAPPRRPTAKTAVTDLPPRNPVCGRTVEILQEVDLKTFPFFLLDSWTLSLHTASHQSEMFVQYVHSLKQAALLARLRIYADDKEIPVCGATHINTRSWKSKVVLDIRNMQEPYEDHLAGEGMFLYFLLLPHKHAGDTGNISPLLVVAKVLLSPPEINTNLFDILQNQVLKCQEQSPPSLNETISCEELVLDQKEKIVQMFNQLEENMKSVLATVHAATDGNDFTEDLLEAAASHQTDIITATFDGCQTVKERQLQNCSQAPAGQMSWVSEADLGLSKFPEKIALQAREATKKGLRSFSSMDSLTASSPLSVAEVGRKGKVQDPSVCDISKYFHQDGTQKIECSDPVKLKGRGLCQVKSPFDPQTQWPETLLSRFHDMYYLKHKIDSSLEDKYTKNRDGGYFQDTQSSFLTPIKKNNQMKSACLSSPVRRSPRRLHLPQQMLKSERPSVIQAKRVSPRKKRMLDDTFKQPSTQFHQSQQSGSSLSSKPHKDLRTPALMSSELKKATKSLSSSINSVAPATSQAINPTLLHDSNYTLHYRRKSDTENSSVSEQKLKRHKSFSALPPSVSTELLCSVRRSPRKLLGSLKVKTDSAERSSTSEKSVTVSGRLDKTSSPNSQPHARPAVKNEQSCQSSSKMKRSERHKLKLQNIIDTVLREKGINEQDPIFASCSKNLFNVSLVLLKTLPTSRNLTEEMKTVVFEQVTQIINLEKRRCGLPL